MTTVAAARSGIELTPKGEAYALANQRVVHFRLGTSPTLSSTPDAATLRGAIEAEIDRLIDLLDVIDGDPDLEPFLAGFDNSTDDREGDPCDQGEHDTADSEPMLGWSEGQSLRGDFFVTSWAENDGEETNEDGGDGEDGASWAETVDQTTLQVAL